MLCTSGFVDDIGFHIMEQRHGHVLYVPMCVYVCDYVRASVSGLLRPFLSYGFYPLKIFVHRGLESVT